MIAAAALLAALGGPAATDATAAPLAPGAVLQRYAHAIAKVREPRVVSFDCTLEQTGVRTLEQTHRIFRSGNSERDEMLTVDGKRLEPPKVRIFRGRRNRYLVSVLAPHVEDYIFTYIGSRKAGRHVDYVFHLAPQLPLVKPFTITGLTIDGANFLPQTIDFATNVNDATGTVIFARNGKWWVPYFATARATIGTGLSAEKVSFYTYRFPLTLPPSTFSQSRSWPKNKGANS